MIHKKYYFYQKIVNISNFSHKMLHFGLLFPIFISLPHTPPALFDFERRLFSLFLDSSTKMTPPSFVKPPILLLLLFLCPSASSHFIELFTSKKVST